MKAKFLSFVCAMMGAVVGRMLKRPEGRAPIANGMVGSLNLRMVKRPEGRAPVANEAAAAASGVVGVANDFNMLEGDWIQLSPIGDFPHSRGLQRVDSKAVEAMANSFNSVLGKLQRRFAGVPFYVGHPDVNANEYPDKKAYGWVKKMESRGDGLYGQVQWSEPGKQLLANAHYKYFSPFWDAEEVVEKGKKIYRPVEIRSVGLTNTPNLPVQALANTKTESENQMREYLIKLLGLANDATDEQITEAGNKLKATVVSLANVQQDKTTVETALANEKSAHSQTKTTLEGQVNAVKTELANERKARIELVLDRAQAQGKITAAQRPQWVTTLEACADAAAFGAKVTELANAKQVIKTTSQTRDAGARREAMANVEQRRSKIAGLVNEKQAKGMSYDDAWRAVKIEHAALFAEMAGDASN